MNNNMNIQISSEHFIVSKLEEYCYILRDAMIDMSLKYPEISTFERYLSEIKQEDSIIYIVGLLHKCWCLAHPYFLFNTVQENNVLDYLTKYSKGTPNSGVDIPKEAFNKKPTPLLIRHFRKKNKERKMLLNYKEYLDNLYEVTNIQCERFKIKLRDNFTIIAVLETKKSSEQLKNVFEIFSKQFNCCEYNENNLQVFISMFSTTPSRTENTILWTDIGSEISKEPSLASIDTIFRSLGIKMNSYNKSIICKYITWKYGNIKPEQIKPRSNEKQNDLKNKILDSLKLEKKSIAKEG